MMVGDVVKFLKRTARRHGAAPGEAVIVDTCLAIATRI